MQSTTTMAFESDRQRSTDAASEHRLAGNDMASQVRRILLTADPFFPVPPPLYGGIERIVASLCEEYRRVGREVGLVAPSGSMASVDALYPWPRKLGDVSGVVAWWEQQAALDAAIRKFRPQLVHSFSRLAYLGRHLCSRIPKVMSYQRHPSSTTTKWAARLAGASLVFTGCSVHITETGS